MKENRPGIGEKAIETPTLLIKKNIMYWENTMIQLSNVSCISTGNIASAPFPILAALFVLAGFLLFSKSAVLAIVLCVIGAVWLLIWYLENESRREGAVLAIRMNSGQSLYFAFKRKDFLQSVLAVLERIIADGGDRQVSINVENCTFSGDADILNGIRI